jgi:hypothetical protein
VYACTHTQQLLHLQLLTARCVQHLCCVHSNVLTCLPSKTCVFGPGHAVLTALYCTTVQCSTVLLLACIQYNYSWYTLLQVATCSKYDRNVLMRIFICPFYAHMSVDCVHRTVRQQCSSTGICCSSHMQNTTAAGYSHSSASASANALKEASGSTHVHK